VVERALARANETWKIDASPKQVPGAAAFFSASVSAARS
jgi:hypothetical protein